MINKPWLSAPISHQLAFKNANISSFQGGQKMPTPTSNFGSPDLAAKYSAIDNQTNITNALKLKSNFNAPSISTGHSPIQERVNPHQIRTLARSGVHSPGFTGSEGMNGTPSEIDAASSGLNTMSQVDPASLGKI
jgi:hypothetical protein